MFAVTFILLNFSSQDARVSNITSAVIVVFPVKTRVAEINHTICLIKVSN